MLSVEDINKLQKENEQLQNDLSRKTQECEELKEWLQANQPTGICETCTAKAILQNDKYRKALEEIEKEIRDFQCDNCEDYHCETCDMKDILVIINKAKGEGKCQ